MSLPFDTPNKKNQELPPAVDTHSLLHSVLLADSPTSGRQVGSWGELVRRSLSGKLTAADETLPRLDFTGDNLPSIQAAFPKPEIKDVVIHGKNGNTDTIAGTEPQPGESLADLIKRLHPDLSNEQLAREVQHMLKYNRDYGNDLGDGSKLDPGKTVYLTSVKYMDAQGRIARIEGPTGRVTEFSWGSDGQLIGYKLTGSDGAVEEAHKEGQSWLVSKNGRTDAVNSVKVDEWGNLIIVDSQDNQLAYLTNGTDVRTFYEDHKPVKAESSRNGQALATYDYQYEGDTVKIFGTFADNPQNKVLLSEELSPEALERLSTAQGVSRRSTFRQQPADFAIDLPTDSFVAQNIMASANQLVGHAVTEFDPAIPTNVGCARMVSEALVKAGFDLGVIDADVVNLEDKLKARHFQKVAESELQPGDVIIALGPGPRDGHTAIYAGNGKILGNSSGRGYFVLGDYQATFGGFESRVGYRYVPENLASR